MFRCPFTYSLLSLLSLQVISDNSKTLAPLAVDTVLRIVDPAKQQTVDLSDVKVVKKLGGTVEDTELVEGMVFDSAASHAAGGPGRITNCKIGLVQFCLSAPKTDVRVILFPALFSRPFLPPLRLRVRLL